MGRQYRPARSDRPYLLAASAGDVPGTAFFRWTCVNPATGTAEATCWPEGGNYAFPTSGATLTISSDDANDTSAGTGARTVLVSGLDSSYGLLSETLTMNGTSGVSTSSSDWFRVNSMTLLTAGTGKTNAGNIYVGTGSITSGKPATVLSTIQDVDEGASSVGVYTVPTGKTAYFQRMVISSDGNKAVQARLRQTVGGVMYTVGTSKFNDNLHPLDLSDYGAAAGTSDLEWRQSVDSGTSQIDVYAVLLIVDD